MRREDCHPQQMDIQLLTNRGRTIMKLSLTVLCFNEEESIPKFYDAVMDADMQDAYLKHASSSLRAGDK